MPAILEAKRARPCGPALTQRAIADFLVSGGYDNHLRRIRRALKESIAACARRSRQLSTPDAGERARGGFVLG